MSNILPPRSLLHRAFSVFLFRPSDGRLLMQKRASEKITFPDMWTNTCCSHPLAVKQEMVPEGTLGVRRAAQRKLHHELGIPNAQVPLDGFVYITRIHYLAPSNGLWGEHESEYSLLPFLRASYTPRSPSHSGLGFCLRLPSNCILTIAFHRSVDYILFTTADVTLDVNPNEASDTCWVTKEELEEMFKTEGVSCFCVHQL